MTHVEKTAPGPTEFKRPTAAPSASGVHPWMPSAVPATGLRILSRTNADLYGTWDEY